MRVPLSWLRDFAPFGDDTAALAATLSELGLVVEGTESVGEGLEGVVVARVDEIRAIEGADRIRLVTVDAGDGPVEVVCGAFNFEVGDLVPLAPVGTVLPGGFAIGRRKMKGVTSNGMLCSGEELRLSEDHEGILVMGRSSEPAAPRPGTPLMEALGLARDVVFDITVEVNRPDASSIRGVARDLAARLELPFTDRPGLPAIAVADDQGSPFDAGPPVEQLATVRVEDLDLCPRFVARVLTGVSVSDSPDWIARRLTLAGMRPINNMVDASNYVMLELGQPTHPYDLDRLEGAGIIVRRATPNERITTLDGTERILGTVGRGTGDDTDDCLICDARNQPVGIAGIMGGASTEIARTTNRVLLEVAYFEPMAVARTSKRLGLRTEASARFEQGCDPAVLERVADRIIELLALSGSTGLTVASGTIDVRGDVPVPRPLEVRAARVNALLGTELPGSEMARLLDPIGIDTRSTGNGPDALLSVTIPTFRPDIRDGLDGEADIAEDVARMYGYGRLPRRTPAWPQPGRLTDAQRDRRQLREALAGLGLSEVWTPPFLSEADHQTAAVVGPYVAVANPLTESERLLRASMVPGLLRALRYNAERNNADVSFFEVGSTFRLADGASDGRPPVREVQRVCAVMARRDDDALVAVATWRVIADVLRIAGWSVDQHLPSAPDPGVLHPTRSGTLGVVRGPVDRHPDRLVPVGVVGELHPSVVAAFGLVATDGLPRRIGWLDLDLDLLLDHDRVGRRSEDARAVSRYPSADMDLALVVDDAVPAGDVKATLEQAIGDECESVELFDVYRGPAIGDGRRSLAYHLRLASLDHTLTDEEVAAIRARCLTAVATEHGGSLRQ